MNRKITKYFALMAIGFCLCAQAQAKLLGWNGGYTGAGSSALDAEILRGEPGRHFGILNFGANGTLGPLTFLAAWGSGTINDNLPTPVSGAVDSNLFSVAAHGTSLILRWDLRSTDYTIAWVVLETDFPHAGRFPHRDSPPILAYRTTFFSNQPWDQKGTQVVNIIQAPATGRPVSHVSFYGVKIGRAHV